MTQEDKKQLLIKELCTRQPWGVKVQYNNKVYSIDYVSAEYKEVKLDILDNYTVGISDIKPYLRPMSSMTEEEKKEIKPLFSKFIDESGKRVLVVRQNKMALYQDWLNAHHFDYRSLIPMGLAIEVTKENNPYKEIEL